MQKPLEHGYWIVESLGSNQDGKHLRIMVWVHVDNKISEQKVQNGFRTMTVDELVLTHRFIGRVDMENLCVVKSPNESSAAAEPVVPAVAGYS